MAQVPVPISRDDERTPFTTLDGSTVRELVQRRDGAVAQSLAEAVVPPGGETVEHLHRTSEEIYRFVSGSGRIRVGEAEAAVGAGDNVVIAPGTPHKLFNDGPEPLILLCCCSPPYSDADTELLEISPATSPPSRR
jgi:mannose-6-phosphate isomerase-like protein (cupin superfamily)